MNPLIYAPLVIATNLAIGFASIGLGVRGEHGSRV